MESFIFSAHELKQKFTNAAIRDSDLFAKKEVGRLIRSWLYTSFSINPSN